ncbi:sensor histidine kinase (plasmid) [Azospirillum baldaniorum]|uniref:sensor histidine kinase n=1 Tax=Azospirillum baldaniorum TaxID=1064539 RepID=UPI000D5FE939|nr:HAMP domain-containing sensor histidine kinase [Azospirillum baldaniorum]AWJ93180.1 sensor histidine kinase [Azospirillum baldaniorum]
MSWASPSGAGPAWVRRVRRHLDTRSFRQAMAIGAVFLVVAGAAVLWSRALLVELVNEHVVDLLERDQETQRLHGGFGDAAALVAELRRRERFAPEGTRRRMVIDRDGHVLYGDEAMARRLLAVIACGGPAPCETGRIDQRGDGWKVRGMVVRLGDGGRYVNAYDLQPMLDQLRAVPLAAGCGVLVFLLTSVAFGLRFSAGTLRRVSAITMALTAYAAGDRDRRVAIAGPDDEFARLGREINRTLDRVTRLVEEVSSVSSSIAHEMRTPLTHLHNRLITIAENCPDDALRRELEEGIEETRRIQHLFRAIMRLGEIETGRCTLAVEPLDARALLDEVAESYLPLAEVTGTVITVAVERDLDLRGDRTLLFQTIANLVDNALKYAPGEALHLSAGRRDGWNEITVADRGRGLAPGQRALAVQRFCRLDPSDRVPGHGLGLAIVDAIARLHGGALRLEDNGPGLRAVVRLERRGRPVPSPTSAVPGAITVLLH